MDTDIQLFDRYSDDTHIFGICRTAGDNLDSYGQTFGAVDDGKVVGVYREGLLREEAIQWIRSYLENGGDPNAFVIVASRKPPKRLWERAEASRSLSSPDADASYGDVAEPELKYMEAAVHSRG